jgi:hypothetical protein
VPRILLLGDSLTFHGPVGPELLTDPRLFPNVMAHAIGGQVDVVARLGWTTRDAWWAMTKDPRVWSLLLPNADALVVTVGGMDHLPAAIPTYLREGIPYLRPGWLRRRVRTAYHAASPHVIRVTGGRLRQLPQAASEQYLTRIVQGARHYRPDLPVIVTAPAPYDARVYPSQRHHASAVLAAQRWGRHHAVPVVDLDPLVLPGLRAGANNADGMHWGWATHRRVGLALAARLAQQGVGRLAGTPGEPE